MIKYISRIALKGIHAKKKTKKNKKKNWNGWRTEEHKTELQSPVPNS